MVVSTSRLSESRLSLAFPVRVFRESSRAAVGLETAETIWLTWPMLPLAWPIMSLKVSIWSTWPATLSPWSQL